MSHYRSCKCQVLLFPDSLAATAWTRDPGSANQMHPQWTLKQDPAVPGSGTISGSNRGCGKLELPGHNYRAVSPSIQGLCFFAKSVLGYGFDLCLCVNLSLVFSPPKNTLLINPFLLKSARISTWNAQLSVLTTLFLPGEPAQSSH